MRLATFNVWNGRSLEDRQVVPERLAVAVATLDADVLGLQEVDRDQPRSGGSDLTAVAAEAMGAVAHRFVAAVVGTPGGIWVAAGEDEVPGEAVYGIALLSRYPVHNWEVVRMPGVGPHFRVPVPGRGRSVLVGEEPRLTLIAEIETPHGRLDVATTHLSLLPGWNRTQLQGIARRLAARSGRSVIMGDLNLPGRLPARAIGYRALVTGATFPALRPLVQLDHILARGDLGRVERAEALRLPVSDHRALVVDLVPD